MDLCVDSLHVFPFKDIEITYWARGNCYRLCWCLNSEKSVTLGEFSVIHIFLVSILGSRNASSWKAKIIYHFTVCHFTAYSYLLDDLLPGSTNIVDRNAKNSRKCATIWRTIRIINNDKISWNTHKYFQLKSNYRSFIWWKHIQILGIMDLEDIKR